MEHVELDYFIRMQGSVSCGLDCMLCSGQDRVPRLPLYILHPPHIVHSSRRAVITAIAGPIWLPRSVSSTQTSFAMRSARVAAGMP